MRNQLSVCQIYMLGAAIMLIGLTVMAIASCGEVTKATNMSEVVDAHFKYEDVRYEATARTRRSESLFFKEEIFLREYKISGKITNNSGINIGLAEFDMLIFEDGGKSIKSGYVSIDYFDAGSTREFQVKLFLTAPPIFGAPPRIEFEWSPPYDYYY